MNSSDLILEQERMIERCDRLLARIAPHPTIRAFLTLLGDQTHSHTRALTRMRGQCSAELRNGRVLANGLMLLRRLERVRDCLQLNPDHLESYESMCDIVQQNAQLYYELAGQSHSSRRTAMYRQLAQEEQVHFELLGDLCRTLRRCVSPQIEGHQTQALTA
jgi:hypothetical protein